ncbi:DnaJ domain-containing protein [Sphingomonas xanthus]|uniref:J domain-containing protein n=1 Tax=Sphingomonas xanthus TaxID=2594473 RepID=A0A516IS36_9SPHN|nr:DnaJ domain-containing protein [Sphingomonas xanthus]QDP19727.1 J domain-containing protein [Sphingomonas xanthus]
MTARQTKWHGRIEGAAGRCSVAGCRKAGEFRAPLTPGGFDGPGSWRLLCLDHVREHNSRYNYFAGMSPEEIEAAQAPIAGWERETRAFAAGAGRGPAWRDFTDPLDAIAVRFRPMDAGQDLQRFSARERDALRVLGLKDNADLHAVRKRYSELVRLYHPDRNGGDRGHEKKLGEVLAAWQLLRGAAAFS